MLGKERAKMVIATDAFGQFVILQAPENVKNFLEGSYCEDNCFDKSTLPTESGVYEAECEIFWDDGESYYSESNDPDLRISVVRYRRLLPLEPDNGKGSPICPQCGGRNCQETGSVFYEKGECDGKTYEEEGYAAEHVCLFCGTMFFIKG